MFILKINKKKTIEVYYPSQNLNVLQHLKLRQNVRDEFEVQSLVPLHPYLIVPYFFFFHQMILVYPGDPIRPIDPIVFDRIHVGFHRKPTSFIKNRSDPTGFL
jgi:hypothetical protein